MEIWKTIKGFENYQVSNLGNVKALNYKRTKKEKIINQCIDKSGYSYVRLWLNSKANTKKIHQLVAIAFLNHKPCGMKIIVDHIDNDKNNNHLNNLQLLSNRENCSKDKKNKHSNYTGVTLDIRKNIWMARIYFNNKHKYIGGFNTELKARDAYILELSKINTQ
jgi:hypothetical protein